LSIIGKTSVNTIATLSLQIVTLLCGFLVPWLIIRYFGSEINGLVSSLTQFLSYINIVEGGVGAVVLSNLYRPLATGDLVKASAVVRTTEAFFKKLAAVFLIYEIVLAIAYPLLVRIPFSWIYVSSLTLILGISTFVQYYFALTWRLFLQADKKMFVSVLAQGTAIVLNLGLTFLAIAILPEIHFVKFLSGLAFFAQPIILNRYMRHHYRLRDDVKPDPDLLKQRWDGFGINLAAMVHATTATIVLTFTASLEIVSVFSVYMLVANGLKSLVTSISAGITPSIGHYYGKDDIAGCTGLFDKYELLMFYASFLCFTVAAFSITPFAMVYTSGTDNGAYYQPVLGYVLMLAECLFCIRDPYVNMAYTAGHFKQAGKYAYTEAALNIALSVLLGIFWGIDGVSVALLVSIAYRTLSQVLYLRKRILLRSSKKFLIKLIAFAASFIIVAMISLTYVSPCDYTLLSWVVYTLKITILAFVVYSGTCMVLQFRSIPRVFFGLFGRR